MVAQLEFAEELYLTLGLRDGGVEGFCILFDVGDDGLLLEAYFIHQAYLLLACFQFSVYFSNRCWLPAFCRR